MKIWTYLIRICTFVIYSVLDSVKKFFFFFLLSLLVWGGVYGKTLYYRSNALGMILREIPYDTRNTYEWVLERSVKGNTETKKLYHNGHRVKVLERITDGRESIVRERKNGILYKKSIYKGIYLIKQITYRTPHTTETLVNYWRNGQLYQADYFKNDKLLYQDVYITDSRGRLQRMTRQFHDGTTASTGLQISNNQILTEWTSMHDIDSVYRYSGGMVTESETYDAEGLLSFVKYTKQKGTLEEERVDDRTGEKVLRLYNKKNRIIYEEYTGKINPRIIEYTYKNDRLAEKILKKPGVREKHVYEYSAEGSLTMDRVYKNGSLVKVILPENNDKREEIIYVDNKPVLKVFYKNDSIVSREPYSKGE